MTEENIISKYREIYNFWKENCDQLKGLQSGIKRSRIVDINIGLAFAMNQIAHLFQYGSHSDFNEKLKEMGELDE